MMFLVGACPVRSAEALVVTVMPLPEAAGWMPIAFYTLLGMINRGDTLA